MAKELINREDNIQETVMRHPETIDVFMSYGLHCVGCHVSAMESIEQGCLGHGMPDDKIASLLHELNETVREAREPFELKLTHNAVKEINRLMEAEGKDANALRIVATRDGGSIAYDFEFEKDSRKDDDRVYEFFGLTVLVAPESFQLLAGTKIDYVSNDYEEGFNIKNPHDAASLPSEHVGCGCGF